MRFKITFILFAIIVLFMAYTNSLLADQVIILVNKDASYKGNWEEDVKNQGSGELVVDPSNLDLADSAPIGKIAYGTVTVTNNGSNGVNITSVNLEGDSVFTIESNSCSGILNGGESCIIKVKFIPTDDQVHNAILKITASTGTLNVDITGKASDEYFCGGSGTEQDPFLICNAYQLQNLNDWISSRQGGKGYYFALARDIDLSIIGNFTPIGTDQYFGGIFDGRGYIVKNLSINIINRLYSRVGLFGNLRGAVVKNLILENPHIQASADYIGALVGFVYNSRIINCGSIGGKVEGFSGNVGGLIGYTRYYSRVVNCFSTTQVIGKNRTGGLVGYLVNSIIKNSYVAANISGRSYTGGLVGSIWFTWGNSSIEDSYVTGSVNREGGIAGGLIGIAEGVDGKGIFRCYAAVKMPNGGDGLISGYKKPIVISSYWDKTLSGVTTSAGGGEGKTTEEMKQQSTYLNWDFDNVWYIDEGVDYPHLRWELNN